MNTIAMLSKCALHQLGEYPAFHCTICGADTLSLRMCGLCGIRWELDHWKLING